MYTLTNVSRARADGQEARGEQEVDEISEGGEDGVHDHGTKHLHESYKLRVTSYELRYDRVDTSCESPCPRQSPCRGRPP